jgi:hypothetical protein
MSAPQKIISGGQTGVDQAALRAAKECGLEIGGWCPPGRECETGTIPEEFPLQETEQERSPDAPGVPRSQRTEWNVRDSDGTLVITDGHASHPPSPGFGAAGSETAPDLGTAWAIECAARYQKPLFICDAEDPDAMEKIRKWLIEFRIETLSVGGPSEGTSLGIGERAYALLKQIF